MSEFSRLPLLTQTIYARILDQLVVEEAGGSLGGATLVSKRIRGHRYWYAQRISDGKKTQTYLGKQSPELDALIERWRRQRAAATSRSELIAMARAGGSQIVSAPEAHVLAMLSGVFRAGAVLVGSHAFAVFGNALGVRWHEAIVRTEDIDIAHDHRIAVALAADVEPADVLASPNATALHSVLDPTSPATTFKVRGAEIEVDLLTPLIGRDRGKPIQIPGLGAAATPLRFLDYLIEETEPAVVLGGSGVRVNVPRPGRFALHKLVVAHRRGARGKAKATKDLAQASALLGLLLSDLPGEVTLAWKALSEHAGWITGFRASLARLEPDLIARLGAAGIR